MTIHRLSQYIAWVLLGAVFTACTATTAWTEVGRKGLQQFAAGPPPGERLAFRQGSDSGVSKESGQDVEESGEFWRDHPHHLSLLVAGSSTTDEDAFTLGIDYEYRVSGFLGLGTVVEYAFTPFDETTLLAVADLHVWRGFAVQTGPGVAFAEGEEFFAYRVGGLYEFELEGDFTVSPQIHYDYVSGLGDPLVYVIAFGYGF